MSKRRQHQNKPKKDRNLLNYDSSLNELRSRFFQDEYFGVVYQRRNGSISLLGKSHNFETKLKQILQSGGKVILRFSGYSGKEALEAAKRETQ